VCNLRLSKYQVQPRLHRSVSSPHRRSSVRWWSLPRGSERPLYSRDEASGRHQDLAALPKLCLRAVAKHSLCTVPSSRRRDYPMSFIALSCQANAKRVSHCSPRPMHPQVLRVSYRPSESVSRPITSLHFAHISTPPVLTSCPSPSHSNRRTTPPASIPPALVRQCLDLECPCDHVHPLTAMHTPTMKPRVGPTTFRWHGFWSGC